MPPLYAGLRDISTPATRVVYAGNGEKMGFWPFSKKAKKSADPIAEFWRCWAESADAVADALDAGTVHDWVEQISAHVHAIDGKLSWESSYPG